MNETTLNEWKQEARKLGADAAEAAASWIVDGNSDRDSALALLKALQDGDPMAYDQLSPPNLSGEWADDPTPASLVYDVTGLDWTSLDDEEGASEYDGIESLLADAWEDAVSEEFYLACEARLIEFLGIAETT